MTTEKLEPLSPCACSDCGRLPVFVREPTEMSSTLIYHEAHSDCLTSRMVASVWSIGRWNEVQRDRLARRKADFRAGCDLYGGTPVEDEFEEYLAKERGE